MVPPPRAGSFSPNPAQALQTGIGHSPNPSQAGPLSATASPSTSSPTGTNPLIKIVVAQVYLLLSTIKEDDRSKREPQADQLRKVRFIPRQTLPAQSFPRAPPPLLTYGRPLAPR